MASPTAMTAITAPAASPAEALEPSEQAILSVLRRLQAAGLVVSSEETPPVRRRHERFVF